MVRLIRHCSSCEWRFVSRSSAELQCSQCCRIGQQAPMTAPPPSVAGSCSSSRVDDVPAEASACKRLKAILPFDAPNNERMNTAPARVSLGSTTTSATDSLEGEEQLFRDAAGAGKTVMAEYASSSSSIPKIDHHQPVVLEIKDDFSDEDGESVGSEGLDDFHCTQLEGADEDNNNVEDEDEDDEEDHNNHDETENNTEVLPTATITAAKKINTSPETRKDICFICGSTLSKVKSQKGRLGHIKRCAKKYGVTGQDVRLNDDIEAFTTIDSPTKFLTSNVNNDSTNSDPAKPHGTVINPYTSKQQQQHQKQHTWHGGAAKDLQLAETLTTTNTRTEQLASSSSNTSNKGSKQTALTSFFKAPVRSLNNVLVANARRLAKIEELEAAAKASGGGGGRQRGGRGTRRWGQQAAVRRNCPQYKRIPGTDFICDGFMYARASLTRNYFLTHFHSDHYGGIDRNWNHGIIYCSLITANLVHERLGVDREFLHPLPMTSPNVVESKSNGRPVTVTLFSANHCPGAVMFLFQIGNRTILHVGDFRWNREAMMPAIKVLAQQPKLDELFLDTTYCDAKYTLPSQNVAIEATVECAVKEVEQAKSRKETILLVFGAYTIGKERIYLSVAERLGWKIYVDSQRYKVLSALEWPEERMAMLTTTRSESNLWVVPLNHISMKNLPPYLYAQSKAKNPIRRYDRVVGFRPTGWSNRPGNSIISSATSGRITTKAVPYSEHSSFPELLDCIKTLKPKKITPTVNVSKSEQQVDLLLRNCRSTQLLLA